MPTPKKPRIPFDRLTAVGRGALTNEQKTRAVAELRRKHPELAEQIDAFYIEENTRLHHQLLEVQSYHRRLEAAVNQLTAPPLHAATYLGDAPNGHGPAALVQHGNGRRVVPLADAVDPGSLALGDELLLNADLSAAAAKAPFGAPAFGETALFERLLSEDRLLVRSHDDQVVIGIAGTLIGETWEPGDLVRWDRSARLAFEKIDPTEVNEFMLETVPDIPPERVGGQEAVLKELLSSVTLALLRPELATKYELDGQQVILLVGPPGTGKTLRAKVVASEVRRLTGKDVRICVVKPGQFEDPYVGMTQRRIRECFKAARRCGGFVLMFLDEIDSIGRARGGLTNHHSDRFLAALLAELQGFENDSNNLVVIAATNRLDLLDPALAERLEVQLFVKRPDRREAKAIFSIHLPECLPFSCNGRKPADQRDELIERAISAFYSPNGDNTICTVRFRDSGDRVVEARELASGRCFEQICRSARRAAAFREIAGGEAGIRVEDIAEAVHATLEKLSATLTRANIRAYLTDLPQDMDVVSVDPVNRRVASPHHYLHVA
jgi:proteasome-associated ATPase